MNNKILKSGYYFLIILSFLLLNRIALADSNSSLIELANEHYTNSEYELAVDAYEKVVATGYEAAELYYNLGNSYYKIGNFTLALLNLERAKLFAPNDEDIDYNLNLLREHTIDKIDVIPEFFLVKWYKQLLATASSNNWAIMSSVAFVLFLIFLSFYLYSQKIWIKKSTFVISIFVLLFSISTFVFSYQQKKALSVRNSAIIVSPSVTVKSSPDESGTELFQLHEGTKVYVQDSLSNWREIRLTDGNMGWIKFDNIAII